MKETIRLFKAIPITSRMNNNVNEDILKLTIKHGFIFSPEIYSNYNNAELINLVDMVKKEICLSSNQMNSTFHKSWSKIRDAKMEQLVMEQMVHYITTYDFEALDIYNEESVYIPNEKLEIPDIDSSKLKLIVIKGYTKKELKAKVLELLKTGIALKEETMNDLIIVCEFVKFDGNDIELIKNKEVKVRLYSELNMIPKNPVEFLRYMIYKSTGSTLIIKNLGTIEKIKENSKLNILVVMAFNKYQKQYELKKLAQIFYRYKPLFLAFKKYPNMAPFINKIRRLADKYHKPMNEDYLNNVTGKLKNNVRISTPILTKELDKNNVFRKIRLLYALNYRMIDDVDSIMYKIRNGKSYATEYKVEYKVENKDKIKKVFNVVLKSIIKDVKKNVKGKKIYLPNNIKYTLPATEKQFIGDLPSGSYISITENMVFGIHWNNIKSHRIDLDLSLINSDVGKIGWDSFYRTSDRQILFSGDITDAPLPNGATELFYISNQNEGNYILMNNYFNYDKKIDAPFKIIIGEEEVDNMNKNYTINPNNVKCIVNSVMNVNSKALGVISVDKNESRFYFSETGFGEGRSSSDSEYMKQGRRFIYNSYKNAILLDEILEKAGAILVDDKEDCDIDLSLESLEKDKIINLLKKNE